MLSIVKRPFSSNGNFYSAGSIITDPAEIRFYRTKVKDGKIVYVNEHNVDAVSAFFLGRYGLDVKEDLIKGLQGTTPEPSEEETEAARLAEEEAAKAKLAEEEAAKAKIVEEAKLAAAKLAEAKLSKKEVK